MSPTVHWRSLYPFESREISIVGHRMHYLDEGEGPVLLLLHGNPTWSFYWREVVGAFRDRYRVVVPDHIGCGLSDKPRPRDGAWVYRLGGRVACIRELIEQLDLQQVTLVAHDWGGAIGMGAAALAPERFERFVFLNTATFRSSRCPVRIRLCRLPILGRLAVQGLNLFARAALRMAVTDPRNLSPAVRAGLLAPYDNWRSRTAIYQFVRDIPLRASHPSYTPLKEIEGALAQFRDHPVCLIWGMRDWCFTPAFLDRFLGFFPGAEVHRLADAGHYVVEEAPRDVVRAIGAFLAAHPLAERPAPEGLS